MFVYMHTYLSSNLVGHLSCHLYPFAHIYHLSAHFSISISIFVFTYVHVSIFMYVFPFTHIRTYIHSFILSLCKVPFPVFCYTYIRTHVGTHIRLHTYTYYFVDVHTYLFTSASVGNYNEEEHPAGYTEEFQRYFYAKKEAIVRIQPTHIRSSICTYVL